MVILILSFLNRFFYIFFIFGVTSIVTLQTYYVRVRAYKKAGKKNVYSKWSNVKKFKSPNLMEIDGNVYIVCSTNDNHQCVCGNVGRWFNSRKEVVKYIEDEMDYWCDIEDQGLISWDEAREKCPDGYECWSCGFCGKWTGDALFYIDGEATPHPFYAHLN